MLLTASEGWPRRRLMYASEVPLSGTSGKTWGRDDLVVCLKEEIQFDVATQPYPVHHVGTGMRGDESPQEIS